MYSLFIIIAYLFFNKKKRINIKPKPKPKPLIKINAKTTYLNTSFCTFIGLFIKGSIFIKARVGTGTPPSAPSIFILVFSKLYLRYHSLVTRIDLRYYLILGSTLKPHSFVGSSSALESKIFNWKNVMKHFTWPNLLTGITIFFIFYIIRRFIISSEWFLIEITFLEDIIVSLKLYRDIVLGVFAVLSRLLVLGFWQEIFEAFSPEKAYIGSDNNPAWKPSSPNLTYNTMDKGERTGEGPSNEESTRPVIRREVNPDPIVVSILADSIQEDTLELNQSLLALAETLKKYHQLSFDQIKLSPEMDEPLLTLLRKQSNIFTTNVRNRTTWVESRSINALMGNQFKLREIHSNLVDIQENYLAKVKNISKIENKTVQLKEFYATLNEYRNLIIKELNKAENIILADIRKSPLNQYPHLRKELNVGFVHAKKEFNEQDSYLKKKVGEILHSKKEEGKGKNK